MINLLFVTIFFFISFQLLACSTRQQLINCSQLTKGSMRLSCFDSIVVAIESLTKNPYGTYIIQLKNGQVWQQQDSKRLPLAEGNMVYIKKGVLGAFLPGKAGKNKNIRVKRIK